MEMNPDADFVNAVFIAVPLVMMAGMTVPFLVHGIAVRIKRRLALKRV